MTIPLFEDSPAPVTDNDIPVTLDLLVTQFIHRNGYNATAQERMRIELAALLEHAQREWMAEVCINAGCQCE